MTTVTATASGAQSYTNICLSVRVLNNASYTQGGATAASTTVTAPQLAITAHAAGNLVYGSALTGASSAAFTGLDASTTSLFNASLSGDGTWNFGHFKSAAATTTSPATYGWTGATESSGTIYIALAEITAAGGTLAEDASTPAPVSTSSAATVATASFTPPAASVLVAMVGTDWTGAGTVTIALTDNASAYTWTQLIGTGTGDLTSVWAGIPKVVTVAGAATLAGSGTLTAGGAVTVPGAASLSGSGALTPAPAVAIPAAVTLLGSGALTAGAGVTAPGQGAASLSGTGTLTAPGVVGWAPAVPLSGSGTFTGQYTGVIQQAAALSGSGVLSVAGAAVLRYTAGLFGGGFLSIPQVSGGLVPGVGGAATPQALPGSSQVAVAPQGSGNWQWLGTLGQVTALTYSYTCPGGCDQLTMTIMVPAAYRTQLFNPGWQVKVVRGGHQVWYGKLDEPQPSASGWTLTAVGAGNLGQNFVAFYAPGDVWPAGEPDEIVTRAVLRGLPWTNPGLNGSPYASQFWLGQSADPGSQTVTAFLNLICTRGGLTWYVSSQPGGSYGGNNLSVFPLPTVPNRLLVATTPVARTLGGDINSIFIRYMSVADNTTTNVAASYNVVLAQNAQSVAAHGVSEAYVDLSDSGVLSSSAAQAVGTSILELYQRASFAGPFQASYGQLLNTGGAPIDPGTDQAGTMVRMILTDWGLGGEVQPGPINVIVGSYSWDDFQMVATITAMQTLDMSLTGMLSAWNTVNTPIAAAS